MNDSTENRKIQHLFWRAGFGPSYKLVNGASNLSLNNEIEKLFSDSKNFNPLTVAGVRKVDYSAFKTMSSDEKKEMRKEGKHVIFDISYQWVQRFVNDEQVLREKMTFFWSGHFACRVKNPYFAKANNNTIRKYALGNFGDLLTAISKDPAMLQFLNNQQNRKEHPNENFAREVMELFTLGRGNYNEEDVKEAARGFTGWGFDKEANFVFRERAHDDGSKTFLGKKGDFNGDDILKIILENKQCAKFITTKIYKFFVNDEPDEAVINSLAENFYVSDYNIEKLMKQIFNANWFYDEKNIGVKIKSPIELLSGMMKNLNITFENELVFLKLQRVLGQELFFPPNVAGWPGGKNWIDNSTLMTRLTLAKKIMSGAEMNINAKEEYDMQLINMDKESRLENMSKKIMPKADWTGFVNVFSEIPDDHLVDNLTGFLLQVNPRTGNKNFSPLNNIQDKNKADKIKEITLNVMSLPEYQLC